jgi:hypothetical protein
VFVWLRALLSGQEGFSQCIDIDFNDEEWGIVGVTAVRQVFKDLKLRSGLENQGHLTVCAQISRCATGLFLGRYGGGVDVFASRVGETAEANREGSVWIHP